MTSRIIVIIFSILFCFINYKVKCGFIEPSDNHTVPETSVAENEEGPMQDERISIVEGQVQEALATLDEIQRTYPKQFDKVLEKSSNISFIQRLANRFTLPPRCAEFIQNGDFDRAHVVLNLIHPDDHEEVIREAFRNNTETVIKIVDFASTLYDRGSDKCCTSLKLLQDQIKFKRYCGPGGLKYMREILEKCDCPRDMVGPVLVENCFHSVDFSAAINVAISVVAYTAIGSG